MKKNREFIGLGKFEMTSPVMRVSDPCYKQFEAIQFRNQGYTNREIAELCGVGRKAIEKRFARIRKILSDYKEN